MSDRRRRHVLDLSVSTITLTETTYHGEVPDKLQMVTAMVEAILPAAITVLQRGRWLRNVAPWREAALFFWFGGGEALLKWLPAPEPGEDLGGHWDFAEDAVQAIVPYCDLDNFLPADQDPEKTWAEQNRQNKRGLRAFALTSPAERLLQHVLVFGPASRLNDRYLTAGSSSWHIRSMWESMKSNTHDDQRILVAHRGVYENAFFRRHHRFVPERGHV